jgi:hypothetical protein
VNKYEEIQEVRKLLHELEFEEWIQNDLWSFNWWLSLSLVFIPLFIWWKVVDRTRLTQIIMFGLFIGIISTFLDVVGVNFILWGYPDKLLPVIPPIFPFDLIIVPVVHMLIFQFYLKWKSFFWANVVVASILTFIAEPILAWMGIYKLYNWEYIFSFPIYIMNALLIKWLVQQIYAKLL